MRAPTWSGSRATAIVPGTMAAVDKPTAGRPGRLSSAAVLARFALSGSAVAIVHLGAVTALSLMGLPIQLALAIGFVLALALHFTLNRNWVFASRDGFARGLRAQGARYLCVALGSYGLTSLALAVLPDALGAPELAVFVTVTVGLGLVGFVVMRSWVFGSSAPS